MPLTTLSNFKFLDHDDRSSNIWRIQLVFFFSFFFFPSSFSQSGLTRHRHRYILSFYSYLANTVVATIPLKSQSVTTRFRKGPLLAKASDPCPRFHVPIKWRLVLSPHNSTPSVYHISCCPSLCQNVAVPSSPQAVNCGQDQELW